MHYKISAAACAHQMGALYGMAAHGILTNGDARMARTWT
jgi:hypothetical protein